MENTNNQKRKSKKMSAHELTGFIRNQHLVLVQIVVFVKVVIVLVASTSWHRRFLLLICLLHTFQLNSAHHLVVADGVHPVGGRRRIGHKRCWQVTAAANHHRTTVVVAAC